MTNGMEPVVDTAALQRRIDHLEKGIREAQNALKQERYDYVETWLRLALGEKE